MSFSVDAIPVSAHDAENAARLFLAMVVGMAVGLNRDLHGKPTGMRTLGLVCMGAALVSLAATRVEGLAGHPDAESRVIQGIVQGVLTGIGFLGAGVVIRDAGAQAVHGLTTAAAVWVTAALGITCALASWHLIAMGVVATLVLLVLVKPLERAIERMVGIAHGKPRSAPGEGARLGEPDD